MIRVYLAEDHTMVRDGLRRLIEANDMELAGETDDGNQALDDLRRMPVDVALLDLSLRGRSGLEVLAELKQRASDVRVIVLTGNDDEEIAVRCIRAGADGFITKGRGIRELADAIRRVHEGGKFLTADVAERIAASIDETVEPVPHGRLTNREFEVMCRLAKGETVSEIGQALFLSSKTIGTYRRRILNKMNLENNSEIARYALSKGLIK